jgi:hypothetical protein
VSAFDAACKGHGDCYVPATMSIRRQFDLGKGRPVALATSILVTAVAASAGLLAQSAGTPYATLIPSPTIAFPNDADSNSPAVWEIVDGQWRLSLFNSVAGRTRLSEGRSVQRLASQGPVAFESAAPPGGFWFESVIRDADSWYGFYHNEREDVVCTGSGKVWPRIGAARSDDFGRTWLDLGPVLETPADSVRCQTNNHYFVGGVGDFSAVLDPARMFVYLYYTQYAEDAGRVGVAVARMAWADRDLPAGRVDVWTDGVWLPPAPAEPAPEFGPDSEVEPAPAPTAPPEWRFPLASPIMLAGDRWDNGNTGVNVFWGPSIHWNTALDCYVMLLNQATSNDWKQGGVFVSYNPQIDDPAGWSVPARLVQGGRWYPQVIGLADGVGTDTVAGPVARFFMGGRSDHTMVFSRR